MNGRAVELVERAMTSSVRFAIIGILSACGGGHPATNRAGGAAPSTGGSGFSAELAGMLGSIADATCACKNTDCATTHATAAMLLVQDIDDVVRKVPSEESVIPDPEADMLGEPDAMAGLDECWSRRAKWELGRVAACSAKVSGEHPAPQEAAPTCATVARPTQPTLDAWWTRGSCSKGRLEETQRNSFVVKRCVDDGVTQDGHETRWWAYNKMPAYEQTPTGWTYWYPDGTRAATMTTDKATATTTIQRWYPNGHLRDERTFIGEEGREDAGKRIDYWPSGGKRIEDSYRGTHVRTYWYASGVKAAEVGLDDVAPHGPFTVWHPSGKVKQTGRYLFGRKHGTFEELDESGNVIKREQYNFDQAGQAPVSLGKPKVTAASLLTEDMVRGLGGHSVPVVAEETEASDSTRDNLRYRAPDKSAAFDVEVRVWGTGGPTSPRGWFDQLRSDFSTAKPVKLADDAFVAATAKQISVALFDKRGVTVLVGCGLARCSTPADAIKLATAIHGKLPASF